MSNTPLHPIENNDPSWLWRAFCADDSVALGTLATQFYKPLLNYGLRQSSDRELLKDLIQELFLDLWTRRKTLLVPDDVKAYLLGAYRNKLFKEHSRSARVPQPTEVPVEKWGDEATPSIEESLIQEETVQHTFQRIQRLLATLPKRQQEVIYLHYYENLEADQIAEMMGIGRQSVYNLLSRTLKDLRSAWTAISVVTILLFVMMRG